jgi:hypothetical protein
MWRMMMCTRCMSRELYLRTLSGSSLYSYRWLEYCSFKVFTLSHLSFQNLISLPPCNLKFPKFRNWSLTFISPIQNWELPSHLFTWVLNLSLKYLFLSSCCQASSPLIKLKRHLPSKLLFCCLRSSLPRPPCSLGLQIILHFVSLYLFLRLSSYQKTVDL